MNVPEAASGIMLGTMAISPKRSDRNASAITIKISNDAVPKLSARSETMR